MSIDVITKTLARRHAESLALGGAIPIPGPPGRTPRVGPNGNWWIDSTDLGVKAEANNFEIDPETLKLQDDVLSVNTADTIKPGSAQPITAGAVFESFGELYNFLKEI